MFTRLLPAIDHASDPCSHALGVSALQRESATCNVCAVIARLAAGVSDPGYSPQGRGCGVGLGRGAGVALGVGVGVGVGVGPPLESI